MTRQVFRRFPFDGLTTNGVAPTEYLDHVDGTENTFRQVLRTATRNYNIEPTKAGYYDEEKEEWIEVPHWNATVNPAWLGDDLSESPQANRKAVWDFPTEGYTPVGPDQWWEPLKDALDQRDMDAFGQLRLSRDGAVQVFDVFFPDITVPSDMGHADDKILGISTGHDYVSGTKLFAEVIAFDPMTATAGGPNIYRSLTEARTRKHTGTATADVTDWWDGILDNVAEAADTLRGVIADAISYEVELGDLPCDLTEFFTHIGLPKTTLAPAAADRAMKTCRGAYSAFHLHQSAAYVLEHEYEGKDSSTFEKHVGEINKLLFNPAFAEKTVLHSLKSELDDEQTTLGDAESYEENRTAVDKVNDRIETVEDGVAAYESTRERLRTILTDLEGSEDEAEA